MTFTGTPSTSTPACTLSWMESLFWQQSSLIVLYELK